MIDQHNKPKLWTKDFILITLANFFICLPFYLLTTILAVYAFDKFEASQSIAGLTSSIFILGALFSSIFTGKFLEIVGRKKMFFGGLVLFLLASLLYFAANNLVWLLVIRLFHGISFGLACTTMAAIAMDIIPEERKGEGISFNSLSIVLATAIGPFIGVFLSQHTGYPVIFGACVLFSLNGLILALFVRIPVAVLSMEQIESLRSFKISEFFEKNALPISIVAGILCFCYSGIISFLTAYAKGINLLDAASLFFIVYAVCIIVSRPVAGRLMDKKGANFVIYPIFVFYITGLIVLSLSRQSFMLLLSAVIIGLGYGTALSCFQTIAIKESPKHRVGLAMSTYLTCLNGSLGTGPFVLGFVVSGLGYSGLYLFLAGIVLLTFFIYYLLYGKKAASERKFGYNKS